MSEGKIVSAERLGHRALLISLSDGTDVLLTLDQLLAIGGPRFTCPREADFPDAEYRADNAGSEPACKGFFAGVRRALGKE